MEKLNVAASVSQEIFIILSVAKYFCANFIYIFFLLWI